jgi:hypothetical protein
MVQEPLPNKTIWSIQGLNEKLLKNSSIHNTVIISVSLLLSMIHTKMETELHCNIFILSPVDQENFLYQLDNSENK